MFVASAREIDPFISRRLYIQSTRVTRRAIDSSLIVSKRAAAYSSLRERNTGMKKVPSSSETNTYILYTISLLARYTLAENTIILDSLDV